MKRSPRLSSKLTAFALVVSLALALTPASGHGHGPFAAGASATAGRQADTRATDANITRLATTILGHSQFAHHPLDAELAGKLLDRFLDALDGTHSIFLQSDVDEFSAYRATLAKATVEAGDTSAARAIFARYLQRLKQQVAFVTGALRTAKFDFTGHDVYSFDREHARRPPNLTAAHEIWLQQLRVEYLQEKLTDKRPGLIVSTLTRRREQQLRTMEGLHEDEVLEVYLDALAHVYDPHSDYLGHEQMESLSIAMKLSLFGIGAALETEDGYCKIRELLPGGPAARSGLLKPGDRIVAVAQANKEPVDIMNMPLSRAVELIRGPKGTRVTLTIIPGSVGDSSLPKTVSLVRDEIKLEDQEAKARILDLPVTSPATGATPAPTPLRLGVIDLPSFYAEMGGGRAGARRRSATADVARLLKKLKTENVRGIVMDLRHNGGGSLEEAISLTGLLIRRGPVVQTRDATGKIDVGADTDGEVLYDGPLVLLTSRFSASATEILVGALQDYGRGVVVGDSSTFGKGTVQNVLGLAQVMDEAGLSHAYDPGALKITISKFYRPGGASTQLRGVASDIVLPSLTDFSDVSESALTDPLPWDTVPPTTYERLNRVRPVLDALRERSARRVKTDQDFASMLQDVDRLAKSLASKSVSLNEAERRRELAETKARHERERKLRARELNKPTSYEITLGNVDAKGLPAPLARDAGASTTPSDKDAGAAAAIASPADKDEDAAARAGGDLILNEGVKILADYVELLAPRASPKH